MSGQFLRIKKLTGKGIIEVAARHNHREIMAELGASHIDPERVGLNRVLRGCSTAAAVALEAKTLMSDAGVKTLKRTAVMALEIVFSLPPETSVDCDRFFRDAVQWTEEHFNVPVISAIVHNDEAAPHCHVLLLPLVAGRMVGSDLMGGRAKLLALHNAFHAHVGERHGLKRQPSAQRSHSLGARRIAARIALNVLRDNGELCATSDAVMDELFNLIAANPAKLLSVMGRTMPAEETKAEDTFVGIMTRPCKPEPKPIGKHSRKPIGKTKDHPIGMNGDVPSREASPGSLNTDRDELEQTARNYLAETTGASTGATDLTLSCVGKQKAVRSSSTQSDSPNGEPFYEDKPGRVRSNSPVALSIESSGMASVSAELTTDVRCADGRDNAYDSEGTEDELHDRKTNFIDSTNPPLHQSTYGYHERRTPPDIQSKNAGGRIYTNVRLHPPGFDCTTETRTQSWRMSWEDTRAPRVGTRKSPAFHVSSGIFLRIRGRAREGGNSTKTLSTGNPYAAAPSTTGHICLTARGAANAPRGTRRIQPPYTAMKTRWRPSLH